MKLPASGWDIVETRVCVCWRRLGDPAEQAAKSGWNAPHGSTSGDEVLAAVLEETEAKASVLDLENARLQLALVMHMSAL